VSTANDESVIREVIEQQQIAWNAGDAHAYAKSFHVEGSFTNVFGDRYIGRESFQARHAAIFNTFAKGSKADLIVRRVHFPISGTAVVDIDCVLEGYSRLPPGLVPARDGKLRTSLSLVFVKTQDRWWIVGYHNVDVKPLSVGAPS
jgi:uncharacterized protein (TIGR02246 family)